MIVSEECREVDDITNSNLLVLNDEDVEAQTYLYNEIPLHYVYAKEEWKKRRRQSLYSVFPSEKERFFLRLFECLKTYNGMEHSTFLKRVLKLEGCYLKTTNGIDYFKGRQVLK